MTTGIILETAVPVRLESSDKSEMLNQLLFGETYIVVKELEKWVHIQSKHDNYEGWIDRKQHTAFEISKIQQSRFSSDFNELIHENRGKVRVLPASAIPDENVLKGFGFSTVEIQIDPVPLKGACDLFMNAPYLWGGRSPYGIDCSGFTQLVFRLQGIKLPRDASQQVNLGEQVTFIDEAIEGDLAFFDNEDGAIVHVGIIMGSDLKTVIHASGRVREDTIDHNGIFDKGLTNYSHRLRTIKRII